MFIYSSVNRHLGFFFFHFLAIMNTVAINIPVQVFVVGTDFISLGHISRSGIAESYGNSMFNFLRTAKVFYSSRTSLHSHQQCMTVPITPHPCQHLVLSVFFLTVIPLGVKQYLIVVLICMSLMANDIEHLFNVYWPFAYPLWRNVYLLCPF